MQDNLKHLTRYAIEYYERIKKKYAGEEKFPRLTEITEFETIAATKVASNNARLYANKEDGFVGINLKKEDNGEFVCDCSDLSEIIVFNKNGKYRVTKVSDKAFFGKDIMYVGLFNRGDSRMTYNAIYKDGATGIYYAKRFSVTGITRDKEYDLTMGTEKTNVLWFTANRNAEAETLKIYLRPRPKLKKLVIEFNFADMLVKGRSSRGNVVSKFPIKSITQVGKAVSTIGGKDLWFDNDIQRLNEDGRGLYLGQFGNNDHVLAIYKDGRYQTTSTDLSSRYQGEILRIEKLDPNKVWSAIYYDGEVNCFYIKRFSFETSEDVVSFVPDSKGSYFVAICDDLHPQMKLVFAGKNEGREAEIVNVEEFIAKKGIGAKGKRVSTFVVGTVEFIEGLVLPEDNAGEGDMEEDMNAEDSGNTEAADFEGPTVETEDYYPGDEFTLF